MEIQVTGKSRTGHFNQMTITNSRKVFMSWLREHASGWLLVQKQTEDTSIRTISKPQNKQAELPTSIMLLETQHKPSSLKDFPHKTGMGNDEPQARLQAELPGMKAPLLSCTYICFALHRKADEKRKSHHSLWCEASLRHRSLPLTRHRFGEPNSHLTFTV